MRKEVIISLILILLVLILSCKQEDYVCGDNVCDYSLGEDPKICPKDCAPKPVQARIVCGDGLCDPTIGEDSNTCLADCPLPQQGPVCGDGKCEPPESSLNCLADCPQPPGQQQQQQAQPPQQPFVPQLSKYLTDVDGSKTISKGKEEDVDLNPEWKYFGKENENEQKVFLREELNKEPAIFFDELMDGKFDPLKDKVILGDVRAGDDGVPIWWTNYAYNSVLGDYYHSIPKDKLVEADKKLVRTATDITLLEQKKSPEGCGDGKINEKEMCDPAAPNDPNNKCADACLLDCSCVPKILIKYKWKEYVIGPPQQGPQAGPGQQAGGQQGAGQQAQQPAPQQVIVGWNYGESPFNDILDSDKDGVPNNLDKCPKTVPGTKVYPPGYDLAGCPVDIYPRDIVFVDNDKDRIWDHQDNCVEDPKGDEVAPLGHKYAGCTEKQMSGG